MSGTAEPASSGPSAADWVRACRPKQWLKNAFVLAPVVFGERFGDPAAAAAAALVEAGCSDPSVLAHCRGPPARGCWVVELVLGKG